jgi:Rrf2 family protein
MKISKKCQYAVRAILELAKRHGAGPVTIGDIARKQAVPPRFLEIILNEMKQRGFVRSTRGAQGGYELASHPRDLSAGQIIRLVDGPMDPVSCVSGRAARDCPLGDRCALIGLWKRAKEAVEGVYDGTSFQDLVEEEAALEKKAGADFTI